MPSDDILLECEDKMDKAVEFYTDAARSRETDVAAAARYNLGTLNVTTISVAHRNNALAAASRFIDLDNRQPVAFGP